MNEKLTKRQRNQEQQVIDYLKMRKGFMSIFWACDNRLRAAAIGRLEDRGEIVRVSVQPLFPNNKYRIRKP